MRAKLDVNISYPEELHDYFNQYPPLPTNMEVKKEYLNEWQQEDYNESESKLSILNELVLKYIS